MSEGAGGGQGIVALVRDVWQAFVIPTGLGLFALIKWFGAWQDKRDTDRRTDQQKRDDAFTAKFARLDEQVKAHMQWLENRAERAEKLADEADKRAEIAERERWRMELWVRDYEHTVNNARQIADDARGRAGQPPVEWKPVPRPVLPGDPA